MQPPTDPSPLSSAVGTCHARQGDEAELYERHHRRLLRAVARAVNAPPELVEDACQTAWTALLRCDVERATVFSWLRVVAINEARRQCARTRNEIPAGPFLTADRSGLAPGEHPEPAGDRRDVPDQVIARIKHTERLEDLARLKPHDRRALYLKGLGYGYREIMQITGASQTAVSRRITEGRHALRKLEHARTRVARDHQASTPPNAPPQP
jgi:RNA polymerase sigma factor (sigma-70 family)